MNTIIFLNRCFLPSFGSFDQAVSEENIFLQIDQSETRIAYLLTDQDEMSNLYNIDSVHLA